MEKSEMCQAHGLARSTAGHDRDRMYVVLKRQKNRVSLADGVHATIAKPKIKNVRHVVEIRKLPEDVSALLAEISSDSDLVHLLRKYRKDMRESICQNLM